MTVSTEEGKFEGDVAESLLEGIEPELLKEAHEGLRASYLAHVDGKKRPGRAFRYHDSCVNLSCSSI